MSPSSKRRDAAAVLLTRGTGEALEVYLVERSPKLRFFGGFHAFPGGVIDPDDGADELAFARCAHRELLEETGVAADPTVVADADALRARLLDGDAGEFARRRADSPVVEPLRSIGRVFTPPFAPVRYDTEFFHLELPSGQAPTIIDGELVGGSFWRPGDALRAWDRGELQIVPPVLILLAMLRDGDLDAFFERSRASLDELARGALHRVQFTPGIIMASLETPTLPPATTTNCLIVGSDELWIIDPATPHAAEQRRLFDLLDQLIAEGRRLAGVIATHHHPDHVGAVAVTSRRYDLPVRAHEVTLARLEGEFRRGDALADGERISLGTAPDGTADWWLEALFTPGHDRGHLCFRDNRYGALIAADMISTVSTIIIDPPEGHLATYLRSLARLQELEIGTLYPAHGPPTRDGDKLVRGYLAHRAQREQALVDAIERLGTTDAETLVPVVYGELDEAMYPYAERSLVAGLEKLQEEGRVG